eukprot:12908578-Prorocentrum_lima.AAC.1
MTGSAAIAALTTGRRVQNVAIVQCVGLRRRAAAQLHAPPCATRKPPSGGRGSGPASRSAASAAGGVLRAAGSPAGQP